MNIFAISDLHLPGGDVKPMDVFGAHWENHFARIRQDWESRVSSEDIVLIPGDISWAMRLSEALPDLLAIGELPGRKILLRGNHDYWWQSISRVREALPVGMMALQNDAIVQGDVVFCGSRGWLCPGAHAFTPDDARVYGREVERLALSLRDADRKAASLATPRLVALLHYPPFADIGQETEVMRLLRLHGVSDVVYGHLHGSGLSGAFTGELDGVCYHQVSCDRLAFQLYAL